MLFLLLIISSKLIYTYIYIYLPLRCSFCKYRLLPAGVTSNLEEDRGEVLIGTCTPVYKVWTLTPALQVFSLPHFYVFLPREQNNLDNDVQKNQRDAQILQIIFIFPMFLFALHVSDEPLVHHQEHCLVNSITQLVQVSLAATWLQPRSSQTHLH